MSTQHWLLPVDPLAHRDGIPADWRERPDPGAIWAGIGRTQDLRRWCLSTGYRLMRPGDLIWVYLSGRGELCAVGRAAEIACETSADGKTMWHVLVDWDERLSGELGTSPLSRSELGQVPMAIARAGATARPVLQRWLEGHSSA